MAPRQVLAAASILVAFLTLGCAERPMPIQAVYLDEQQDAPMPRRHRTPRPPFDRAGRPPAIDVTALCASARGAGTNTGSDIDFCVKSESLARDQLDKSWSSFAARDRSDCVELVRTASPNYVEILTCLELSRKGGLLSRIGAATPEPVVVGLAARRD